MNTYSIKEQGIATCQAAVFFLVLSSVIRRFQEPRWKYTSYRAVIVLLVSQAIFLFWEIARSNMVQQGRLRILAHEVRLWQ